MLFEGAAIVIFGTEDIHLSLLLLFLCPAILVVFLVLISFKRIEDRELNVENAEFEFLTILKLSIFVIAVLSASHGMQILFGESGFYFVTFVVSLFEIHGSVIANLQMHDVNVFDVQVLGDLIAISVFASLISKLFLVYTIGSRLLFYSVTKFTFLVFVSLVLGWSIFFMM